MFLRPQCNGLLAQESQDTCPSQELKVDIIILVECLMNQSLVFIQLGVFPIKKGLGVSILAVKYLKE